MLSLANAFKLSIHDHFKGQEAENEVQVERTI